MVIEMLTFPVAGPDRDGWLQADRRIWTSFLETCDGFVRKELWHETPDVIHAVIWWQTMEHWKAIDATTVARLDADMGTWHREPTCRAFNVL